MRVVVALITTATWLMTATSIHIEPIHNIIHCGRALGVSKCLSALTVWRAENALAHPNLESKLLEDLEQFPWKNYSNSSDEELRLQLCDETERLLRRRSLSMTMLPGYRFELLSKSNGTLNVDVYRDDDSGTERGMKKAKKMFYKILPLLVVPGLIMSAILPFFLPVLKMMTLAAVIINNMAFTGAVFTLLRNNAFNDKYEHKVIYVNEGYKNEQHLKHAHISHDHEEYENYEETKGDFVIADDEHGFEEPLNSGWANHQGHGHFVQNFGNKKRSDKI